MSSPFPVISNGDHVATSQDVWVSPSKQSSVPAPPLSASVPAQHVALLFDNGQCVKTLEPGRYGYWNYNRDVGFELYDLKLQTTEISGQEILTKDRVSLRSN